MGPYCVVEVLTSHTHCVERSGQILVQSKRCLKSYHASPDAPRQALPPGAWANQSPEEEWHDLEWESFVPRKTEPAPLGYTP